MKILNERPPIYARAAEVFPLEGRELFAYGDTIYNPGGLTIPDWLIAHEEVHEKQQEEIGVKQWWDSFLESSEFRLEQELPAHQMEYRVYCYDNKDRNKRARYRQIVAKKLAAPLYGNIISYAEALRRIK